MCRWNDNLFFVIARNSLLGSAGKQSLVLSCHLDRRPRTCRSGRSGEISRDLIDLLKQTGIPVCFFVAKEKLTVHCTVSKSLFDDRSRDLSASAFTKDGRPSVEMT